MADAGTESSNLALLKEATLLLLGASADNAVHCGDAEVEALRKLAGESREAVEGAASTSQVLMSTGALSQAIAQYCTQTQRRVDALLADVGVSIQSFLGHLEKLHADTESQAALAALRTTFEEGLQEGNLAHTKEPLLRVLQELGKRTEEQRRESLELTSSLQDRITILEQSVPRVPRTPMGSPPNGVPVVTVDPCTGLLVRSEAEAALNRVLEDSLAGGPRSYAAIFYLHRMSLTNARFGEAIGNQVILFCSQHIATVVTRGHDALYRWSGPAFIAILERPELGMAVNGEVQQLISAPLSRFFETSSRSVYLPVKVTAEVVPLFDTNFAEVSARMERFILRASGQAAPESERQF